MSTTYSIKELFTIKDKNIEIDSFKESFYKEKKAIIIEATLSRSFSRCPYCKGAEKQLVKNGKKISMILLNRSGNKRTYLRLRKQRYHCRSCGKYFTVHTYLVAPSCFISKQVHYTILEELTVRQSIKTIAKRCDLSVTTVQRTLSALAATTRQKLDYLPHCLLFDEFRSLSTSYGKFSFSCMDGETGKLFDILPSRRKKDLIAYFMRFSSEARSGVRYIVTDMNAPYFSLVKECFPNAQIIIDRFHIVQHLNKFFDNVRKRVMKQRDQRDKIQAKYYRQLKSLYKLLLKSEDQLDYTTFRKWQNFQWRYLTETEVVDRLLSISSELKIAYQYYQKLLTAYHEKQPATFFQQLREMPKEVPAELHHIKKAFFNYEKGIRLAFLKSYSNAKLENLHTHIKCLKRIAYGFRSFTNMRLRIFLINGLISYT